MKNNSPADNKTYPVTNPQINSSDKKLIKNNWTYIKTDKIINWIPVGSGFDKANR